MRVDDGSDTNIPTCADTALDECTAVAVIGLTPGTWLVTGTVTIDNFDGPATSLTDRCGLWRDGATLAEARTPLATDGSTPVSLKCTEMVGENLRVGSPTITALKVG